MARKSFKKMGWIVIAALAAVLLPLSPGGLNSEALSNFWSEAAAAEQQRSLVSIVRSDNPSLSNPAPADSEPTYPQIEQMVRRAIALSGGLETVIPSDTAWVVIKPNIVRLRYPPAITDWRVVKALIKVVHETAPKGKITIAEGPATWMTPGSLKSTEGLDGRFADGFAETGYRQLLSDPELSGITLDIVDLNFDECPEMAVPGGGNARETYFIPRTILDCDVLISVPKMKMHKEAGVTAGMKNMVGIAPGMKYGWAKMRGYPPGSGNPGLPHSGPVIDEMVVDLNLFAGIDFCLVDALLTQDGNEYEGPPIRLNLILAGSDVVSVDAICARVIGLNPDDVEHLTLAEMLGLGNENLERIDIVGEDISGVIHPFTRTERWTARYGQGNRTWLLKGPFSTKKLKREFIKAAKPQALPGNKGWSDPVYFGHDKIDLAAYFGEPTDCVAYAYTDFIAPKTQPVELWLGSEEDLTVWINGKKVYAFQGKRRHGLPNEKVAVTLPEGKNQLLVKVGQTKGEYSFSLNICEVEEQAQFAGNRPLGLKFVLPGVDRPSRPLMIKTADIEDFVYGQPVVINNIAGVDPLAAGEKAPRKAIMENVTGPEERAPATACLRVVLANKGDELSQEYLLGLAGTAFTFDYSPERPWLGVASGDKNSLSQLCERLGYSYALSYNEEAPTAWTRLKGWISEGYPVIVWRWQRMGLVAGYDDQHETVHLARADRAAGDYYAMSGFTHQWEVDSDGFQKESTTQFVVGSRDAGIDPKEGIVASLDQAVRGAKTPFVLVGQDTLASGFAAYELWLKELAQELVYDKLSEDDIRRIIVFDTYFLPVVVGNRKAAAVYLKEASVMFDQPRQQLLLQAAQGYQAVAEQLEEIVRLLPQGSWREMSFSEAERKKLGNREKVAQLVREVYEQERKAIALLEEVVR